MLKHFIGIAGICLVTFGCVGEDNKLFIMSVNTTIDDRVDWYFHSLISNFSRSYLQFQKKGDKPFTFFESFYISNISNNGDTLRVELYENNYKLYSDKAKETGLIIKIDATGGIWNQASSRLGRLQRKNVDVSIPHFVHSYCPKNECYY